MTFSSSLLARAVFVGGLLAATAPLLPAQSAVTPSLRPIPAKGGICHSMPETQSSRKMGIVRTAMFDLVSPDRSVSVSVNATGQPLFVTSRASVLDKLKRTETENVLVFFQPDGSVRSAERRVRGISPTSGATMEQRYPLGKADTLLVRSLATSIIKRCMR